MRHVLLLAAVLTSRLVAQTPPAAPTPPAVAVAQIGDSTIVADLVRHALALAHDSLRNRAAPGPALERTARYVAAQFEQFGLRPGHVSFGDSSWFQRYPVPGRRRLDASQSGIVIATALAAHGKKILTETHDTIVRRVVASFDTAAHFIMSDTAMVPTQDGEEHRPTVLVAGRLTAAALRGVDLHEAQVLYVPPAGADAASQAEVLTRLQAASHGLVVLNGDDSMAFVARRAAADRSHRLSDDYMASQSAGRWAAEVWPAALVGVLQAAGVDLAELRAVTSPVIRPLPSMRVHLRAQVDSSRSDTTTVPNVIGVLPGTDSSLRYSVLVVSAHLDHSGRRAGPADSAPTTESSVSELAGLLALAQAFVRSGVRPRRPIVFLASSGGAPGGDDWGSNYYISTRWFFRLLIGANVTLEQLDSARGDTLLLAGAADVELPHSPAWIMGLHPELRLTLWEESPSLCPAGGCWVERSAFARVGVPGVAVNTGPLSVGSDRAEPAGQDAVLLRDAEREARVLRFAYDVIADLATARQPPRWSAAGRQRWRTGAEP